MLAYGVWLGQLPSTCLLQDQQATGLCSFQINGRSSRELAQHASTMETLMSPQLLPLWPKQVTRHSPWLRDEEVHFAAVRYEEQGR